MSCSCQVSGVVFRQAAPLSSPARSAGRHWHPFLAASIAAVPCQPLCLLTVPSFTAISAASARATCHGSSSSTHYPLDGAGTPSQTKFPSKIAQMTSANGVAAHDRDMKAVFPEALKSLASADPEVAAIIEDEKRRQWCAQCPRPCLTCWCCRRRRRRHCRHAGVGGRWSYGGMLPACLCC